MRTPATRRGLEMALCQRLALPPLRQPICTAPVPVDSLSRGPAVSGPPLHHQPPVCSLEPDPTAPGLEERAFITASVHMAGVSALLLRKVVLYISGSTLAYSTTGG